MSRNRSHFRSGRRVLVVEGAVLVGLGSVGLISYATHFTAALDAVRTLGFALTSWHSGLLLGFGLLALVGAVNRRAAVVVTSSGAVAFLILVIGGAVSATHHAPGPLGLQPHDIVLHAALSALNFGALYWLLPDALEGPDWVRRAGPQRRLISTTSPPGRLLTDAGGDAESSVTAPTTSKHRALPALAAAQNWRSTPHQIRKASFMNRPQNIVITGASAGVGRACARAFGARGDNVALLARGKGGLDGAVKDVEAAGGHALAIPTDVADYQQVASAAVAVEETFGQIDVWVNVAFTSVFAPFHQIGADEYRRITEVSYLGYVHGTMVALKYMRPRGRGTIVQVGSALGARAIPLQSAYCGAKHAINGFTESVRTELMHDRSDIRITIAQMPALNTPQFSWVLSRLPRHPQPVPPIYQPEIAARAVLFAAQHPQRKQYWVGASTTATILGQRLAPALLDRYLAKAGYESQQTKQPVSAHRPNNLWKPIDDDTNNDHGAHGIFEKQAIVRSPQLWLSQHARASAIAALTSIGVAIAITSRRRG